LCSSRHTESLVVAVCSLSITLCVSLWFSPSPSPLTPSHVSTDNSGPPESVEEVVGQWDILRWQFPGANIIASTFDDYVDQLAPLADSLPSFNSEVGDVWITSTTADPVKMSWNRLASREYAACVQGGQCNASDPRVFGFLRMLMKLPEHTYGIPGLWDSTCVQLCRMPVHCFTWVSVWLLPRVSPCLGVDPPVLQPSTTPTLSLPLRSTN
jgi:hypothetical protein